MEERRKKRRRRVQKIKLFLIATGIFICFLSLYLLWCLLGLLIKPAEKNKVVLNNFTGLHETELESAEPENKSEDEPENKNTEVSSFPENIPAELLELLEKNPETEEFVLNYPNRKNEVYRESLPELLNQDKIPLLLQWDSRWGYYQYGDNVMGLTGCGPTCLSMVAIQLLQDPQLTPVYIADYSIRNGYCVSGSGSSWELMSQGAEDLGLQVEEVPLNKNSVIRHLKKGNPIICIMGKGDFTDSGHFVVFAGEKDGKLVINDPNSKERSKKLWEFEEIENQIRNMWVYETH